MLIYAFAAIIYKPTTTLLPWNYGHRNRPITGCRQFSSLISSSFSTQQNSSCIAASYQHHFSLNFPGFCFRFCTSSFSDFFSSVYTLTISANDERQPWPLPSQGTELFPKYTPRSKFFLGKSSPSSLLETGQHAGGKTFFGVGTFPPSHAITIFSRTLHTFKHKGSTVSTKQKLFQAGRFHLLDWLATY